VGTQYRSAIFCHGDVQCAAALASKERMDISGAFSAPIVTHIEHAGPFYRAEEYHQQYFEKHRDRGCSFW
jgi:peptide-methionine (S)-S-oxide reductase